MKLLIALFLSVGLLTVGIRANVNAAEDIIDDDDEATVQVEDEPVPKSRETAAAATDKDLDPEEDAIRPITSSADIETQLIFTEPALVDKNLAAGVIVKFLVGCQNKGQKEYLIESMDVSFRYPMDYSFFIQNYTDAVYNRLIAPGTEMSFDYSFIPSEAYAGRPLGLSINLRYSDLNKTQFLNSVFNETVNIVEDESGFNPETGFLYVIFACLVVLLLVFGQQFLSKMRKKHGMTKRSAPVEMGTTKNGDIDYDWIPKELLQKTKNTTQGVKTRTNQQARKDQ